MLKELSEDLNSIKKDPVRNEGNSGNEWIKKLWYIYRMEYCTEERKKELLLFMTAWKELDSIMLSEISQVVKDKYHMISPISGT